MANLYQPSIARATLTSGVPANAARLSLYQTGTTTAATWYLDQAGTTAGTNPLVSNSVGVFAPVYLDPETTYRVVCTNSSGSETIYDVDPVRGYDQGMVQTASEAAVAASAEAEAARDDAEEARDEASSSAAAALASETAAAASETAAGVYANAAAAANTGVFADTTAGLAAAASGEYFLVKGADDVFAALWLDNAGVAVDQNLSLPSSAALADKVSQTDMGLDTILTIPLEQYPDQMRLIVDEDADDRIWEQLPSDAAAPLVFGTAGGATENVGTGAGVYVGTGASGAAQLRSLVGVNNVTCTESGNEIEIEVTGEAGIPPTEYVVVIVLGQSNATESGGDDDEAESVAATVAMHFLQGPSRLADLTSGDEGGWRASFMPAFGKAFWLGLGEGVIFVNKAVGGTAMHEDADEGSGNWSAAGSLRGAAEAAVAAAKTFLDDEGICYRIGLCVLSQGERDAQAIDDTLIGRANYKTALEDFVTWIGTAFGSKMPLMIARTGRPQTADTDGFADVREVQMEVADETENVFIGWTGAFRLPGDGLMDDDLHYDQEAKNRMGRILGRNGAFISAGIHSV